MTLNTTGDETPNNNTRTSDEENNNSNNNTTGNGTKKRKKKKKKGNVGNVGGGSHDEAGKTKFEGLSKEEAFKGVVLECGKAAIQAQIMREACITHANGQKQPRVADSILYKTPI